MPEAEEDVQEKLNDTPPNILDQVKDVSDDEELRDGDRSMFDIPPIDDQNKQEEGDKENDTDDEEKSGGMPEAVQTSSAAKKLNAPSIGNIASLYLEELKWSNSIDYLKAIISAKGSSNEKCISSSTVSGGQSKSEYVDNLLKLIKEEVFDVDLLQVLKNDPSACFWIKDLMKRVDILNTSPKAPNILMELGLLIDQINADLQRVKDASTKI